MLREVATVGAPEDVVHARLCARLVLLLRESVGEDRRWPEDLGPGTRLDADLALDSLETAAFAARLREHYGDRVDLLGHLSALDLDALIELSIADLAGHIAARLAESAPTAAAPVASFALDGAGVAADAPAPAAVPAPERDRSGRR